MNLVRRTILLLLCVIILSFCLGGHATPPAFAALTTPNKLEIARTPGLNNGSDSSHQVVLRALLVKQLYAHILTLPAAPADQVCPMYLIASYQLTFFHDNASILHVNAINGECQPVTLPNGDVRTADEIFWKLLNQAQSVSTRVIKGPGSLLPTFLRRYLP